MPGKCHKAVTAALRLFREAETAPLARVLALPVPAGHAHKVLAHLALALELGPRPLGVLVVFRDLGELALGLLDLFAGRVDVDLAGLDRLLDEDLDEVLGHLEEPVGGGEDVELLALPYADVADLGGRDNRGVVDHHPDVAVRDAGHDEVGLPVVDHLLGGYDPAEKLPAALPLLALLGQPSLPAPTRRRGRSSAPPDRSRTRRSRPLRCRSLTPPRRRRNPRRRASSPSRRPRRCCRRGRTPAPAGRRGGPRRPP